MPRTPFSLQDLASECRIETGHYCLDGRPLGLKIFIPQTLQKKPPYNGSAYVFLQQLRAEIFEYGIVEFPDLTLNRCNYTLAQRAPQQHAYSTNTYMTGRCQSPHQDTPPYPSAFWLAQSRRFFSTWVMPQVTAEYFYDFSQRHPQMDIEQIHRELVARSVIDQKGLLLNQSPGLLLIDNSEHCSLYHARTCNFEAQALAPHFTEDTPMYAYNEVGLLNYIDVLDSRRGPDDRDQDDQQQVVAFMEREQLPQ